MTLNFASHLNAINHSLRDAEVCSLSEDVDVEKFTKLLKDYVENAGKRYESLKEDGIEHLKEMNKNGDFQINHKVNNTRHHDFTPHEVFKFYMSNHFV